MPLRWLLMERLAHRSLSRVRRRNSSAELISAGALAANWDARFGDDAPDAVLTFARPGRAPGGPAVDVRCDFLLGTTPRKPQPSVAGAFVVCGHSLQMGYRVLFQVR